MTYRTLSATLILVAALLGVIFAAVGPGSSRGASANPYPVSWGGTNSHADPEIWYWQKNSAYPNLAFQQNWIKNGNLVDVCSNALPANMLRAVYNWNIGAFGYSVFHIMNCSEGYQDAEAEYYLNQTDFNAFCLTGAHMCTWPLDDSTTLQNDMGFTRIYMNPSGHNGSPWDPNDPHTTRDLSHELGHVLGLGDDPGCSLTGQDTIMDGDEVFSQSCPSQVPTALDVERYHIHYHPDPVMGEGYDMPYPNFIHLMWTPAIYYDNASPHRAIPNESGFNIIQLTPASNQPYGLVATAPPDAAGVEVPYPPHYTPTPGVDMLFRVYTVSEYADWWGDFESRDIYVDPASPTPTRTPTRTKTPTLTPTATFTPVPTSTFTPTATVTPTPWPTETPTFTPGPTITPSSVDSDGDTIPDNIDNCPNNYNPDQTASGAGMRPAGPIHPWASNPASDWQGDACDTDPTPTYKSCSPPGDSDGDGIPDCVEHLYGTCATIGDSTVDYSSCANPTDSDGDGCPDWLEAYDVNGTRTVDTTDLLIVAKRVGGQIPPDPVQDAVLDVNHDGLFNSTDNLVEAKNTCVARQNNNGYTGPCTCGADRSPWPPPP